ncbi:hypothetical protein CONLIGDRAFT_671584 [Coniochaeta ligniaria NRRL 30616]|uniref:Uncharacterized protein n=1 Tax=Coniochaeta ligniaria NRRL 30616 TaxID=1408157 RepID=A0A1J7J3N3_9PEZI|nr:hypothetical protein CONLIGDRAFT_671584 [Coniochaeta ligniaria NRRL 30616]
MSVVPPAGIVRKYYEEAAENIEYRSSAFWQVWLQREFAKTPEELETYAVTSESSPNGSLRRVDQVVRRYDRDHHNLASLIWNECKRPSGNPSEAEAQALDAAQRCIRRENLLWIYALTTVGVTFRVWKVVKRKQQLMPLMGTMYINADSEEAWITSCRYAGGDGGVLPSQSHLLKEYAGEPGESSMQGSEQWYEQPELPPSSWHMEEDGQQQMPLPASEDTGMQSSTQDIYYEEAGGSTAVERTTARTAETWSKVEVHKTRHLTGSQYSFTTNSNHVKDTVKDDWMETEHKGRRAWYYRHKGVYYYTRVKP